MLQYVRDAGEPGCHLLGLPFRAPSGARPRLRTREYQSLTHTDLGTVRVCRSETSDIERSDQPIASARTMADRRIFGRARDGDRHDQVRPRERIADEGLGRPFRSRCLVVTGREVPKWCRRPKGAGTVLRREASASSAVAVRQECVCERCVAYACTAVLWCFACRPTAISCLPYLGDHEGVRLLS